MKKLILTLCLLVSLMLLTGSSCEQAVDPATEAKAEAICETIVGYISAEDYASVAALARDDVKDMITADALEEIFAPMMAEAGEFKHYKDTGAAYTTNKESGETFIITATIAKYQSAKYTYSIYLDPNDLSLVGIYAK